MERFAAEHGGPAFGTAELSPEACNVTEAALHPPVLHDLPRQVVVRGAGHAGKGDIYTPVPEPAPVQ
jgi:hypothetical protein